ncbi:hypothetical protein [Leisingera sp.]|uniref:hypothetical protein n=1 Tax=Leisingera sp. TaxID=1879318 RepID=UPI002B274EDE|nr:hypothetical protein [Leisingera sp.]
MPVPFNSTLSEKVHLKRNMGQETCPGLLCCVVSVRAQRVGEGTSKTVYEAMEMGVLHLKSAVLFTLLLQELIQPLEIILRFGDMG